MTTSGESKNTSLKAWHKACEQDCGGARLLASLEQVFACSHYVARQCLQRPQLLLELDKGGRLHQRAADGEIASWLTGRLQQMAPANQEQQMRALRQLRHQEMVRIAWRDLAGWADLEETLADLSALADACVSVALKWAQSEVAKRHGQLPDRAGLPQTMMVVAMGKLGGGELNFSSDIDLVLLYRDRGDSNGKRVLDSDRYFARVAQTLIQLLDTVTEDGFVFRVDIRLRPFGSSGAVALSFDAFELYLQNHGRDWERYAYIKAKPITGSERDKKEFIELVRPFVYRRYLDFGVLESLREMKQLISADVARSERRDDIKLGPGGIREIEFIVQSLQLLRGGNDGELRCPELQTVLPKLAARNWLDPDAAFALQQAYVFLRCLENRIQQWNDEQSHQLPQQQMRQNALASAMSCGSYAELLERLQRHRQQVSQQFSQVVEVTGSDHVDELGLVWAEKPDANSARELLQGLGYTEAADLVQRLSALRSGTQFRLLDARGRSRLKSLVPVLLRLASRQPDPDQVAHRALAIVESVGRRSAYFALLNESPAALERLVQLVALSPWVARRVAESPILLDELLDPRMFEVPPTRADFETDLANRFEGIDPDDLELQMDALRQFKHATTFRVAVTDLSGVLPLMKVSDRLCDIAELVLSQVIKLAREEMQRRFGKPVCGDQAPLRAAEFGVIGYGKLGGLELGYASDLDVVFLHDSDGEHQHTDGASSLDNARYFARLGQRIMHMLSTTTTSGVLYEVDMRLRPSGKAGPMVSSLVAYERYQRESAWTWEHQALLRARWVAGDPGVGAQFEQLRLNLLTQMARNADELRTEVSKMRERMRKNLPRAGTRFDIKQHAGGITDIEFVVQFLVLANAANHPELVRYSDNIRQLEALGDSGVLSQATAQQMAEIYKRYRQQLHRLALADAPGLVEPAEFGPEREWIRAQWSDIFAA